MLTEQAPYVNCKSKQVHALHKFLLLPVTASTDGRSSKFYHRKIYTTINFTDEARNVSVTLRVGSGLAGWAWWAW